MDTIPKELQHEIFSYFNTMELTELYRTNDTEFSQLLNDHSLWFHYFKVRLIPILEQKTNFVEWIFEYHRILNQKIFTHDVLNNSRRPSQMYFRLNMIHPISLLLDLNNARLNDILLDYQGHNSLIIKRTDQGQVFFEILTDSEEYVILDDHKTVYDLLLKLLYYNNQPE